METLGDCFFCKTMKPGTKFIPLKALSLPEGTMIPAEYTDAEFLICPECDAQPFEWKEARMLSHLEGEDEMRQLSEKYVWPFRASERWDGLWVVLDANDQEVEGLASPNREQIEDFIKAFAEVQARDQQPE